MTNAPSLALRVTVLLTAAQLPAFVLAWIVMFVLGLANVGGFNASFDEMASVRVTALVDDSLVRGEDGLGKIEPTHDLQEEMQRVPGLLFAVFDPVRMQPLAGSSPKLVSKLASLAEIRADHLHFTMGDDQWPGSSGHMMFRRTPIGLMQVALYGQKFRPEDLFFSLKNDLAWVSAYLIVGMLTTVGVAWIVVRRGLTPLRAIVGEVARIDLSSLRQRLPTRGVPVEIAPLVEGMNEALMRLDAGVERQRRFTANAAHELRTPLAIMRARLENAKASTLKSELLGEASQLRSIVEQMLVAARLTEGQTTLDQSIDLERSVRQIVSNFLPLAMDCNRFIDFESSGASMLVRGNQRAIDCVVTNLIDNALRAEPKDGTIVVRVDDDGIVAIIDHGEGVAPALREMVFEAFWRKTETTSGTGLGLAIAKEIMDAHGGRIWVEDTPGGGATFKIALTLSRE
ncbi:two-component sensor histidine kinase [Methylosinus sp. C49]|uniref:sensor histidine kinase n=1 Tax=Methylosinus sp. C49 TaxID=2699395 RepID=UPI0013674FDE|nr:HAMP domain-containing sensor histidine kinase [Methylosinus sp. C49]BBU61265.1 two-component sensor histidine kinase [Methylosinus sp. C49]